MKRKDLLAAAGCSNKRFDNLALREQLPFRPLPIPGLVDPQSDKGRKLGDYSLRDAFQLRLMLDLVENQGLSLDVARYIASNSARHLIRASERYGDSPDIWLVFAQNRPDAAGNGMRTLKATTLADLPRLIEADLQPDEYRQGLAFIAMVNATTVSEAVAANALAAAIISADSFSFEPLWMPADNGQAGG